MYPALTCAEITSGVDRFAHIGPGIWTHRRSGDAGVVTNAHWTNRSSRRETDGLPRARRQERAHSRTAAHGRDRDDSRTFEVLDVTDSRLLLDLQNRHGRADHVPKAVEGDVADDVIRQ